MGRALSCPRGGEESGSAGPVCPGRAQGGASPRRLWSSGGPVLGAVSGINEDAAFHCNVSYLYDCKLAAGQGTHHILILLPFFKASLGPGQACARSVCAQGLAPAVVGRGSAVAGGGLSASSALSPGLACEMGVTGRSLRRGWPASAAARLRLTHRCG